MQKKLLEVQKILKLAGLPSHDDVFDLCNVASTILENEKDDYRPLSDNFAAGSLLDFRSKNLTVIVVPDIHARPDFLLNIINYVLPEGFIPKVKKNYTVFQALSKGYIRVICVGDALHTELNTKERWLAAMEEFNKEIYTGPAISAEMLEGMKTICALMKLKELFPKHFHFLKGNHENITNRSSHGDFAFRKFANEGYMVREFIHEFYGDDILYLLSCVENAMPLMAVTGNCVISHAEPKTGFTLHQIINAREYADVVAGLTWTANDDAEKGSVEQVIANICGPVMVPRFVYLAGHRPVKDNYALRQNNQFIQIHNPAKENICLVYKNRKFNPETDIINVDSEAKDE